LFQQFHQWQQQHYPEQAESQEALFEEFLRQLQSR
jgi:hypothetical protein